MAQPRFNGQRFTNPIDPLGFHSESRHRVNPQISQSFMSNEHHYAENLVFNAGAGVAIKQLIKNVAKQAAELVAKVLVKSGILAKEITQQVVKQVDEAVKKAGDDAFKIASDAAKAAGKTADEAAEAGAEAAKKAMMKAMDDIGLEGLDAGTKAAARRAGREGIEEGFEEGLEAGGKKGLQNALQEGAEEGGVSGFRKALKNPYVTKTLTFAGVTVVAGYAVVMIFGADGVMSQWIEGMTGMNCGEKAEDAGLDEGTDDYKAFVDECQKRAERRMAIMGVITVTIAGLGLYLLFK